MNGKLFAVFVVLAAFVVVVTQATAAITVYSDVACTTPVAFYAGSGACGVAKRSVQGGCSPFGVGGPRYTLNECTGTFGNPSTPIPDNFVAVKYSTVSLTCDFADYDIMATARNAGPTFIVLNTIANLILSNITISCNNDGKMGINQCTDGTCVVFDPIPYDTCSNITAPGFDMFSGIQTSCVPVPQAPMVAPMVASPIATPEAATPTKAPATATPVKKSSDAASLVVGTVVSLLIAHIM